MDESRPEPSGAGAIDQPPPRGGALSVYTTSKSYNARLGHYQVIRRGRVVVGRIPIDADADEWIAAHKQGKTPLVSAVPVNVSEDEDEYDDEDYDDDDAE